MLESARKSERLGSQLDDAVQFVDDTVIEEEILMAELNASLRAAFAGFRLGASICSAC